MTRHLRATGAFLAALALTFGGCTDDDVPETEDPSLEEDDVTPPTTG